MTAGSIAMIEQITRSVLAFAGLTAGLVLSGARPAFGHVSSQVVPAGSLEFKPMPWVNTKNASLATKTLIEAGISDYVIGDQATISSTSCYTIIAEPHTTPVSATALMDINLRRMFLNAVLTPAFRPAAYNSVVATPDLTVQKAVGGTLQEEYAGVYTVSVTNSGTAATVEAFSVVDTLPAGVTHIATAGVGWMFSVSGQVVTANHLLTLEAGAVASFSITVKFGAAAIGTVTNRAHVSGGGDTNTSNNTGTNVATIAGRPNISLLKSVKDPTATPGALLQYTLSFKNEGTAPAENVVLVDPLPPQVLFAVNSVQTTLPTGVNAIVEYSRDSAVSWAYTPLTAGCGAPAGFDACVTHLRWRLLNPLDNTPGSNAGTLVFSTLVK